jgi:transposase-like protein
MRSIPHPPEIRAEARRLGETTTLSCAEIAARLDVPAPTVRNWKRIDGWQRPPGAPARRPFTAEQRDAIGRMLDGGASLAEVARAVDRHPDIVARSARRHRGGAGGPGAALATEEVARLREALLAGGVVRAELLALVGRALGFATLDLISDRVLPADRRAQALARTAVTIKALPDDAPAAGVSVHDHQFGPANFEEYNALLEELAERLSAFGAEGEVDAGPREPPPAEAATAE